MLTRTNCWTCIKFSVIWDATMVLWRHCNENSSAGWMAEKVDSTMDPFHEGIMSSLLKSWENHCCNYHSITIFNYLTIVEDWTEALDNEMIVGAILVDQYKAFDCLPHRHSLLHVNNREAGDLRRRRAHYDVTAMSPLFSCCPAGQWSLRSCHGWCFFRVLWTQ